MSDKKKCIVHVIPCDKFTVGYVNFMKIIMTGWKHEFIVINGKCEFIDRDNILFINKHKDLIANLQVKNLFSDANKIIVSGVFGYEILSLFFSKKHTRKMYLQFWGGDFYLYRDAKSIRTKIEKVLMKKLICRSAAIINLVEHDYEEISKIFPNNKKHFTAPVPSNPKEEIDYEEYRSLKQQLNEPVRILIGNSATVENQHEQAFKAIEKYQNENIEVICPLAYGDDCYKEEILILGKKYFGTKFKPIISFMSKPEYVKLLSTCDIGIFNNNRQQALGNINILIDLEKKVYIRDDTSMWEYYKEQQIVLENVKNIENMDFVTFTEKNLEQLYCNREMLEKQKKLTSKLWEKVFSD